MSRPDAAVAIVHTRTEPESVLLMRRSERPDDPWSGHWSLPGGRWDPEDRDLMQTALRELKEECGIRLAEANVERALPPTVARRKTPPYLLVAPFVFRVDRELKTTLDAREAVDAYWIHTNLLRDPGRHCLQAVPGRPKEMLFPTIELSGAPLWGFTYRLLTDWMRPPDRKVDGMGAANVVLDALLSLGLRLRAPWSTSHSTAEATVEGAVPVEELLARFAGCGPYVESINTLDVRPHEVRMLGPVWEEYRITAV